MVAALIRKAFWPSRWPRSHPAHLLGRWIAGGDATRLLALGGAFALLLGLCGGTPTASAGDRYAITIGGGILSVANRSTYDDWVALRRETNALSFQPLHTPWVGHVGWEIFRDRRARAQLSVEGLYMTRQKSDSAGTAWMAALSAFSLQSSYAVHLVRAPSWCVPYVGCGLGYEEASFDINESQAGSASAPGAFHATSGGGYAFALTGFDAFLSSGVAVGIRAEYRLGRPHRFILESAGPSEIAESKYLPLAADVRNGAGSPEAWRAMRYDPTGWGLTIVFHLHFKSDGLLDESSR